VAEKKESKTEKEPTKVFVVATKKGYYGQLREVGARFWIKSEKDMGSWMEEVKPKAEEAAEKEE